TRPGASGSSANGRRRLTALVVVRVVGPGPLLRRPHCRSLVWTGDAVCLRHPFRGDEAEPGPRADGAFAPLATPATGTRSRRQESRDDASRRSGRTDGGARRTAVRARVHRVRKALPSET